MASVGDVPNAAASNDSTSWRYLQSVLFKVEVTWCISMQTAYLTII